MSLDCRREAKPSTIVGMSLNKNTPLSADSHFQQMAHWLKMESEAEAQRMRERRARSNSRNAEKSGESLLDLAISDHETGMAGRYMMTFVKRNRELRMPWHRLRVGSPVVVSTEDADDDTMYHGVVSRRHDDSIQVALEQWPDGQNFRIDMSPDEITRRRQAQALNTVLNATGRLGTLRKIMLGERAPKFQSPRKCEFYSELNPSQQEAVCFSISCSDLAVIHGPPGTGKTTTVVELIRQAVKLDQSVLACAPSNTAADNLLERLVAGGVRVVRLGHPARVAEHLREYALDMLVEDHDNMSIINDMYKEAESLFRQAGRFTRAKPVRGAKQDMRREAKRLKSDARRLERQTARHILDGADVICATTTLDPEVLGDRFFDWAVIDEACQSTEPGTWVPMMCAYRVVLAGDHCQLPPTVLSDEAAREGFARSLMERVVDIYGGDVTRRLDVQYRMHEEIQRFSSEHFYDGDLQSHESVVAHTLSDLDHVADSEFTILPVSFIDSAGAGWEEELEPDGESKRNPEEARLVLKKVNQLNESGLSSRDIAVIAPYAAQVRLIRDMCSDRDLEIGTVDGFQGREKEAVIISLVRSNERGEIGFLSDTRRMNVALTRARRKLIVIGDSATLANNDFFKKLLDYFEEIGGYGSVWEEMD